MGREIKRVPAGFNWPIGKVWEGFLNPHYKSCPNKECCHGYRPSYIVVEGVIALLLTAAEGLRRRPDADGNRHLHPYFEGFLHLDNVENGKSDDKDEFLRHLREQVMGRNTRIVFNDEEMLRIPIALLAKKDKKRAEMRLNDFKNGGGFPLGFDAIDRWECTEAFLKWLGIKKKDLLCPTCMGESMDPAVKQVYEAWKETPIPEGDWWQVWETVSEGSPVTPAFPTAEALIDHLCLVGDDWSKGKPYSRDAAENFVKNTGWVPSLMVGPGGVKSGIEIAGTSKE